MFQTKHRIFNGYFVAAVAYYGVLCVLSHIPGDVLAEIGFDIWDKAVHVMAYSVLGFLFGLWLSSAGPGLKPTLNLMITSALVLILGSIDETHQLFVVGRYASLGDVVADMLGGIAGGGVAVALRRLEPSFNLFH